MIECLFCSDLSERLILDNDLAYVIRDGFPVTEHHMLIIPKRHAKDYFSLTKDELLACDSLIHSLKQDLEKIDPTITGFNIGMNAGESAGQTVFHCHIHLIPRRQGDVPNPRGGVRGVIPSKQSY